jgi:SlyX protein
MSAEIEQLKQQLMEVQSQLAFQEDTMQGLNDALSAQQQEILLLRRQLELLKIRQDEQGTPQEPGGTGSAMDEKPPHY